MTNADGGPIKQRSFTAMTKTPSSLPPLAFRALLLAFSLSYMWLLQTQSFQKRQVSGLTSPACQRAAGRKSDRKLLRIWGLSDRLFTPVAWFKHLEVEAFIQGSCQSWVWVEMDGVVVQLWWTQSSGHSTRKVDFLFCFVFSSLFSTSMWFCFRPPACSAAAFLRRVLWQTEELPESDSLKPDPAAVRSSLVDASE